MSWTYDPASAAGKDRVRRLIGDTVSTAPADERLEDEEIADFIASEGGYRAAAAMAARALAAKILRKAAHRQVGTLTLIYQQRHAALMDIAAALEADVSRAARPYVGGASIADRGAVEENGDRVEPVFKAGMFDNRRSS